MISMPYRDVWSPIWPNLAASALWAPAALWWHHCRMQAHVTAEMNKLRTAMIERKFEDER